MKITKNKKANAAIWIGLIFTIFLVGTVFLVASQGWDKMYTTLYPKLNASHRPTFDQIDAIWDMWPILYIVGAIVTAIYTLLRRTPDRGYY